MENRDLADDLVNVTLLWEIEGHQDDDGQGNGLLTIADHAIQRALKAEKALQELRDAANLVVGSALGAKEIHNLSRNDAIAYHTKFCKTVAALEKQLKVTS
jgi:hypothetical protein